MPRGFMGALPALVVLAACEPAPSPRSGLHPGEPIVEAARLRMELRGTAGLERQLARERAVAACRAIVVDPSMAMHARAEAAFRAAELLRAGGATLAAAELFERCHGLDPRGPFAAPAHPFR